MDQTSVNNSNEEEETSLAVSTFSSVHSRSGRRVPDDCHSVISDDLSVDWTKLLTEDTQIGFFLSLLPKFIEGLQIYKNAKLCNYLEIDLILSISDVFIIVEAKRSVTKQMMRKGREQVTRYCNCFRALYPDARQIGFLYTPLGPKLICDIGNRSAWDPYFQPLFDTINYRGYKRPKRWNRRTLQSQSGRRPTYKMNKRAGELPMLDEPNMTSKEDSPSVIVDAGVHHTQRMRAKAPTNNPFSIDKIFRDDNTRRSDIKFLRAKFADSQRDHFAAPGSSFCESKQITPLEGLMKEMKISTVSDDGFSKQESVKTVPATESDDIGV